jgi:peptidoglycan hydrolase CwlO-like protein
MVTVKNNWVEVYKCGVRWTTMTHLVRIAINTKLGSKTKTNTEMNTEILLLISNMLTGITGWFVGRRKSNAETDNQVLRNLELSIGLYKNIIDDLKQEIHELNNKIQDLEKKVEMLMDENKKLKRYNGI